MCLVMLSRPGRLGPACKRWIVAGSDRFHLCILRRYDAEFEHPSGPLRGDRVLSAERDKGESAL